MALKFYQSFDINEKDFDELICRECARNGSSVDTLNFCVGCESLFCFQCLQDHRRDNDDPQWIPNDETANKNNNQSPSHQLETNNNISYSKNTSDNQLQVKYQLKQSLLVLQKQLNNHINYDKTENENRLQKIQEHADRKINELRMRIMDWLDEIQKRLTDSVLHLHDETEELYAAHKLPVHILMAKTDAALNKLHTTQTDDIEELVCFTEQTKSEAMKLFEDTDNYDRNILKNLETAQLDNINTVLAESMDELLCNINALTNSLTTDVGSSQTEVKSYNVQGQRDTTVCDINSSCFMPDGSILLTDWNNTNIKLLNQNYKVTNTCDLPGIPWAICCAGNKEVAISLHLLQKIQFVSVTENRLELTHSFKVRQKCRGVSYADNKIYVGCGGGGILEGRGQVHVYNRQGALLQAFKLDRLGNSLFSCPQHIAISEDKSELFIADKNFGIIQINLLDKTPGETSIQALEGSKSEEAKGICLIGDSTVLMCDFILNNITVYRKVEGKIEMVQNLLDKKYNICNPQSLCYNKLNNHLVVTSGNSNLIQVFETSILK